MNTMESIECEGESDFHSVTDINCEQEGEALDLGEQGGLLMVSKVTQQSNGTPLPTFIYTNETVRAVCLKTFLPEPIHVSFLNEYDCVL